MPNLEVSMPRMPTEIRARLARELTSAFVEHTGHTADIFGIRFFEYEWATVAAGGRLCAEDDERPYLHALLYSPRLKRSVKQGLASALTDAFTSATGRPAWKPVIHICEHPYDNVVVEGRLLSEALPELAERPFYYPTDDA